jgi:hypothetical protein
MVRLRLCGITGADARLVCRSDDAQARQLAACEGSAKFQVSEGLFVSEKGREPI